MDRLARHRIQSSGTLLGRKEGGGQTGRGEKDRWLMEYKTKTDKFTTTIQYSNNEVCKQDLGVLGGGSPLLRGRTPDPNLVSRKGTIPC